MAPIHNGLQLFWLRIDHTVANDMPKESNLLLSKRTLLLLNIKLVLPQDGEHLS